MYLNINWNVKETEFKRELALVITVGLVIAGSLLVFSLLQ